MAGGDLASAVKAEKEKEDNTLPGDSNVGNSDRIGVYISAST
jgi:hypothetical protein